MLKESESPGRRRLFRLPSPAIVIAMIALLIATAGTAYGVKSVKHYPEFNGVDIIDHSLSGRDVKNGSLFAANLNSSVLRKFRGQRGAQGAQGIQGPQGTAGVNGQPGATGPPGPIKLFYKFGTPLTQPATHQDKVTAQCDAGTWAVGGGVFSTGGYGTQSVNSSVPLDLTGGSVIANGWGAWVDNNSSSTTLQIQAYVICTPAASVSAKTAGLKLAKTGLK
jgi:hypothetical protein